MLAYVPSMEDRQAFGRAVTAVGGRWIANEAPTVLPDIAAAAGGPAPHGKFLLSLDGRPVAWTDPHGGSIRWIASSDAG